MTRGRFCVDVVEFSTKTKYANYISDRAPFDAYRSWITLVANTRSTDVFASLRSVVLTILGRQLGTASGNLASFSERKNDRFTFSVFGKANNFL